MSHGSFKENVENYYVQYYEMAKGLKPIAATTLHYAIHYT